MATNVVCVVKLQYSYIFHLKVTLETNQEYRFTVADPLRPYLMKNYTTEVRGSCDTISWAVANQPLSDH